MILFSLQLLLALSIDALPATSTPATTHIVSYVNQRRATKSPNEHNEFDEFDFENFRTNLTATNPEMRGALQQLFGRFVENLETNLDNVDKDLKAKSSRLLDTSKDNEISYKPDNDDLMVNQVNTLDSGFGENEQHESQVNETTWQRSKQSIPVLETVRDLVNSVRNGALNHTEHASPTRHHQLLHGDTNMNMTMPHNGSETSTAIETEEEREMINGSNDLKFLEVLGSLGSRVWGFLSSLKQVFAASSGSASAALSAQSSTSSS